MTTKKDSTGRWQHLDKPLAAGMFPDDAPSNRPDPNRIGDLPGDPEVPEQGQEAAPRTLEAEAVKKIDLSTDTWNPDEQAALAKPLSAAMTEQAITMAEQRIKARMEAESKLRKAALTFTNHLDWIAHKSESGDLLPYLQDIGSEKLMHAFGVEMEVQGHERMDYPDTGTFEVVVYGRVRALVFSPLWYPVVGSRWSGDGFFDKGVRTDPGDVRKAAFTSFYNRGVKKVLGLRGVTMEELTKCPSIDTNKIRTVTWSEGKGKGGGAQIPDILAQKHLIIYVPYEDETNRNILKKQVAQIRFHSEKHPVTGNSKVWIAPYSEAAEKLVADLKASNEKIAWKVVDGTAPATNQ